MGVFTDEIAAHIDGHHGARVGAAALQGRAALPVPQRRARRSEAAGESLCFL